MNAPERIWIDPSFIDSPRTTPVLSGNLGTAKPDRKLPTDVEYRRADLPPTDAEVMALGPIAEILADAVVAAEKAMIKFPQPNYVISKWAEETGEVTKALIHAAEGRETWENVRGEIVQSLAMLHRLMIEGDQVHGLPPLTALAAIQEAKT